MKVHFEYGDLVIYAIYNTPHIGKYVRKESGRFVIIPIENGNVIKRQPKDVIKLALAYKNNKEDIQRQTWSLQ